MPHSRNSVPPDEKCKNPGLTIDINVKGSVNLMDAVRELFYKPRVLPIGSGEEMCIRDRMWRTDLCSVRNSAI